MSGGRWTFVGAGCFDMKSGIALMLHAIEALRAWHEDICRDR